MQKLAVVLVAVVLGALAGCERSEQAPSGSEGPASRDAFPQSSITPVYVPPKESPVYIPPKNTPAYVPPKESPVYIPPAEGEDLGVE